MSPTNSPDVPPTPKTPIGALGHALILVDNAIALAKQGLVKNPPKEVERELNDTIHELELQRTMIVAKMDALIDKTSVITGPTPEQVAKVSALTTEVGALTKANVTASAAVALTTKVLAAVTQVAAG